MLPQNHPQQEKQHGNINETDYYIHWMKIQDFNPFWYCVMAAVRTLALSGAQRLQFAH